MNDFKVRYNGAGNEMKLIEQEIKDKDLESKEPLPYLASVIDRLSKVSGSLKDLKAD